MEINRDTQLRFIDKTIIEAFKHLKIADVTTSQMDISNYRILNDTILTLLQINGFETTFEIDSFSIKTSFGDIKFGLNDGVMDVLKKIETMLKAQSEDKSSNNEFKSLEDVFDILPEKYIQEAKSNAEEIEIELDNAAGIERLVKSYKGFKESKLNYCYIYMGERIFNCDTSVEEFERKIIELQKTSIMNRKPTKPPILPQVSVPTPPFFMDESSIPPPNVLPPSAANPISQGITPNTILGKIKNAGITSKEIAAGYGTIEQSIRHKGDLTKVPYSNMDY